MITAAGQLAGAVGEKKATALHQSSTTTIADLCSRARRDPWPVTMRALFREAHRFFGDEDVDPMILALHRGEGRFDIHHSGEGELEDLDRKACEVMAMLSAIKGNRFFVPPGDREPLYELLRSRAGDHSFAMIPLFAEAEISEEGLDAWRKNPGCCIGSFMITMAPGRARPSEAEWSEWCMFIPRIYQIMEAARGAGRLGFRDIADVAPPRDDWRAIQAFKL